MQRLGTAADLSITVCQFLKTLHSGLDNDNYLVQLAFVVKLLWKDQLARTIIESFLVQSSSNYFSIELPAKIREFKEQVGPLLQNQLPTGSVSNISTSPSSIPTSPNDKAPASPEKLKEEEIAAAIAAAVAAAATTTNIALAAAAAILTTTSTTASASSDQQPLLGEPLADPSSLPPSSSRPSTALKVILPALTAQVLQPPSFPVAPSSPTLLVSPLLPPISPNLPLNSKSTTPTTTQGIDCSACGCVGMWV